jgi:hypothetical protein
VGGVVPIHVTQSNNILAADVVQIAAALTADADAGDVEFLAGRRPPRPTQHVPRHNRERPAHHAGVRREITADLSACSSEYHAFLSKSTVTGRGCMPP